MKILLVHNAYQQRGGEDAVAESEVELLRQHGHEVECLQRHNRELKDINPASAALQTLWSLTTHQQAKRAIKRFAPDVVHVHNTFPLVSPSIYWACSDAGVPVVQTLHNFRLACPQAMFLRDGKVCEDCLGVTPWPALRHGCYRGSHSETAVLSSMLVLNRSLGTWINKVDLYIALNEFCRAKFVQAGLPAHKLVVKPNFVETPPQRSLQRSGLLFAGRLSPEKGVDTLAKAASLMGAAADLSVLGSGPQQELLNGIAGVKLHGATPQPQVLQQMAAAVALVLPSICYESFPRTLVEAFACALPVLASRIGSLAELVVDGQTGLHFNPGDAKDLAEKMAWALAHPAEMAQMGQRARLEYERKYTPEQNHSLLMAIYKQAMAAHQAPSSPSAVAR